MNEKELLSRFLNGFPNSTHPIDSKNFIKYAVACVENNHYIDVDAMKASGVEHERVEDYMIAFDWIKGTMDYLSSRETL